MIEVRPMKAIKQISRWIDTVVDWIGRVSAFLVLLTLAVILCEVVMRRFFHRPQIWTMDMICMSFGCYVILIAAYGFQKKTFVAVDVLFARFPAVVQHILHLITYVVFMVPFIFVLVPESFRFFQRSFVSRETAYSVWAPPVWPVKLCLAIGMLLLSLQGLSEILKHVAWLGEYFKNGRALTAEEKEAEA